MRVQNVIWSPSSYNGRSYTTGSPKSEGKNYKDLHENLDNKLKKIFTRKSAQ